MSTKQTSAQIIEAQQKALAQQQDEIVQLRAALDKRTEELKSASTQKDSYYRQYSEGQQIIEEIHTILDCMPNPPPRKSTEDKESYRYAKDLSVATRFTIWSASKGSLP